MIFYLSSLQNIDQSIYEAAKIDGANAFTQFFKITVPLLKPIILFTSITSTIGTLQIFDEIMNITKGGPGNATMSISQYIYNLSFKYSPDFGYAATVSYSIVILIIILSIIQFKVAGDNKMAKSRAKRIFTYVFPIVAFISIFPFFWMIVSATNKSVDVTRGTLLPGSALIANFNKLLDEWNLIQAMGNSAIISIVSTILALLIGSMAGYGFEIYRTKSRDIVFTILLMSMMIPFAAIMIPLYRMFATISSVAPVIGINTMASVIIPTITTAFLIFFFRQNTKMFPKDLLEAGRIDGLSELGIFLKSICQQ